MIDLKLVKESKPIELKLEQNSKGGTNNYNELDNKPTINGKTLQGNLTLEELGIIVNAVKDILINGTSIVDKDGNANVPIASETVDGVAKVMKSHGIKMNTNNNALTIAFAEESQIRNRNSQYNPLVPKNMDYAFKCAMTDGKGAEWTSEEKTMAKKRMGVGEYRTLFETTLTEPVGSVVFNTDMDGNRFEVEEVIIILENCKVENTRIRIVDTTNKHEDFVNIYYSVAKTDNVYKYIFEIGQQIDGTHRVERHFSSNTGTLYENVSTAPFTVYSKRNVKYLTRLQIDNNGGNFSAGTRIWVGGR